MRLELTQEIVIRAIHRLERSKLTPEENLALYGICYGTHGHDYKVRVTVGGPLDDRGGQILSRDELMRILNEVLIAPFDGTDLNELLPNTACEALAQEFYLRLKPQLGPSLKRVGVQETRKNYFEFPVGDGAGDGAGAGTGADAASEP